MTVPESRRGAVFRVDAPRAGVYSRGSFRRVFPASPIRPSFPRESEVFFFHSLHPESPTMTRTDS
ncbi:MAG: hypothetical protein LBS49_11265, partial [Candidatus Accumulibacter sp.]|nr:hypothetical protein [Accumulibacter sp.]